MVETVNFGRSHRKKGKNKSKSKNTVVVGSTVTPTLRTVLLCVGWGTQAEFRPACDTVRK